MDSSRLSFKLFIDPPAALDIRAVVPVFHSWIQEHSLKDHLLIDVADYSHVHNGPGIVLVSQEANYSLDLRGGKLGLSYQRKHPIPGAATFPDRIRATLRWTIEPALLLAERFNFRTDEIEFRICDRLEAPNTAPTFESVKADLLDLFPGAQLEHRMAPSELFTLIVKTKDSPPLTSLRDSLAAGTPSM